MREAERNFPRIVDQSSRALDLPRPRRSAAGRLVPGEDRARHPVRRRVAARSRCASASRTRSIERLRDRYAAQGGVKVVVQTTGDILTDAIVDDLLARGVWMISVASVDDFHVGLEGPAKQQAFVDEADGAVRAARHAARRACPRRRATGTRRRARSTASSAPRRIRGSASCGRAAARGRTACRTATLADNFCNRWSGGLNFLRHRVQRLRGVDRARRRGLSVLRQDEAADRQPARGRPDRHPRLAGRRAGVRGDHHGPSGAHGARARLERGSGSSPRRARPRPTARPTRTCASAATASTSRCWARCSRRRGRAGRRRKGSPRRRARRTFALTPQVKALSER